MRWLKYILHLTIAYLNIDIIYTYFNNYFEGKYFS